MRGFPPVHVLIFGLAFALLAIPLSQMTSGRPAAAGPHSPTTAAVATESTQTPCFIRIRYAHRPSSIRLTLDGRDLMAGADLSASPIELHSTISKAAEGMDLFLSASWPNPTADTALTVEIEPDGLESREETRWSADGKLDEVLTFQW